MYLCMCVFGCVCMCVGMYVRMYVCACVCVCNSGRQVPFGGASCMWCVLCLCI